MTCYEARHEARIPDTTKVEKEEKEEERKKGK
jgi:hypothetical protein